MADSNFRKRVYTACDSCRLKKTKCDGKNPCHRCEVENAICVFGNRRKFRNGNYPQGFVEKLLKDREFLVKGVQALYQRLQDLNSWERPPPAKLINGEPYIHSLLDRLGIMTSNEEDETTTGSEGDTSLADTAVVNTAIVDTAIVDTAIVDTALDTALVDTCFDMTPEVENNFHELSFSASTYLHLTPPITPYRGPADVDLTLTQALNPYHVSTQPAPLLTPPTDNSCSSIHMENRCRMQQHQLQDSFSLGRGWDSGAGQESCSQNCSPLGDYF